MNKSKSKVTENQAELSPLGQIVATPGALEALKSSRQTPAEFLTRHATGDWGDLSADEMAENEFSIKNGFRLLSSYLTASGQRLWVITEAQRDLTTLLLPDEY